MAVNPGQRRTPRAAAETASHRRRARDILPFPRAFLETAEATQVLVAPALDEEYLDLAVGHTDVPFAKWVLQGLASRPLKTSQAAQVPDPSRNIKVLALVADLDACSTEPTDPRCLLPQRPGHLPILCAAGPLTASGRNQGDLFLSTFGRDKATTQACGARRSEVSLGRADMIRGCPMKR